MNDQLIIGYDAKRIVSNGTGLGSYGRTLVNDIARCTGSADSALQLRLYAPDEGKESLRQMVSQSENIVFSVRKQRFPSKKTTFSAVENALWRTHGIIKDLQRDGVQLYHGLSGELPVGIRKSGIKSVVTIHDLIFLRHPEYYHWVDTKIYAWKFRQTLREADHIIAISECTKRDIMAYGHIDEGRISVIYQSFAPRFSGECRTENLESANSKLYTLNSTLPKRYMLSVGSIEARKNILLAVKALPYLPEDISLVIVGRHTKYTDQVIDYAKTHNLNHRVQILHGVTDEELPALYAGAEAFVYPSRYEGFGIPIIEAISMGLPVVACTGSCLEEAGGPDSLYVDPDDEQAMAQAIRQSLKGAEGREQRITRSRAYIRRFEGQDVASQVIRLYQDLLAK
jgi:glycosyltransferase involved in cell wall biosynthesis